MALVDPAAIRSANVTLYAAILARYGVTLAPGARILDLGCGDGASVHEFRKGGFEAFGVDFLPVPADRTAVLVAECLASPGDAVFHQLAAGDYRLPYPDAYFALVFSEQVMEHVRDYRATLSEVYRVLRPGGAALHFFPSRWRPIEPHVFVPLAGVIQAHLWLLIWAAAGIRNSYQRGMDFTAVARTNHTYLRTSTNYLPRRTLGRAFSSDGVSVHFAERAFIEHTRTRLGALAPLVRRLPFTAGLVSAFHTRVVVCIKRDAAGVVN
jgi:SAM-dependent methyltransferase